MKPKPIYLEALCPHCRGIGCPWCNNTGQARDYEAEDYAYDQYIDKKIDEMRGK